MTWNYRIVRFKDEIEGEYLEVKEVFYNRDGSLAGYCDADIGGGTIEEIMQVLDMVKADAHKAVIDESEFYKGGKDE